MVDRLVIDGVLVATFDVFGVLGDAVKDFDLSFEVETEEQLREVAAALGGIERLHGDDRLLSFHPDSFYGSPRTEGGRLVDVHVWLSHELAAKPTPTPPTVLTRLRDEAEARAAEEAQLAEERAALDAERAAADPAVAPPPLP